ncbi:MAG: M1 family aminopeptidase [Ginsengibacter sp.]
MRSFFLMIITFISTAYAQLPKDDPDTINNIANIERRAYTRAFTLQKATSASENFDVKYYRCEWQVDPTVRFISGKVTSYYKITASADHITFDLTDSLEVDSVIRKNSQLSFSHTNNALIINFASTIISGSIDSASIYYHGIPPNSGFGSFVTTVHEGVPVLWTLSEPYGSRDWWPCKNGLDDKTDSIDIIITSPSGYTAASNGLRQTEVINGPNKITLWKHRYPIATYLVCMAVTNYSEFDTSVLIGNTNLPMQTFCYPESLDLFKLNTPLVLKTLQFYSGIFGNYPFIKEKYGHVQFGWGGGQEHQTSTFIVTPNESLMSHELAHQWFGDKITCGSWQDIWLNEGFATHLASMDLEAKYPLTIIPTRKKEIANITSLPGGSVWVDDTTNANRIFNTRLSYTKGSHLLYILRWKLGDSVFFKGIRRYFNDSAVAFGFARTSDFKRDMEAVSGIDLKEFFDDWFYGQGYPSYNVRWTQIGNNYVKINLTQTTSDPSVNFFPLPVALQFKNATQQKTIVVNNTFSGEIFFNDIGFIADTVIVDPDYWLITKNNVSQKINDQQTGTNSVQLFPVPFKNNLNIYLQNFNSTSAHIKIYDMKGSLILNESLNFIGSSFNPVNTQSFPKGTYIFNLQTGDGFKFVKKILKQ